MNESRDNPEMIYCADDGDLWWCGVELSGETL